MPQGARDFYVPYNIYTSCEAQSASYATDTVLVPGVRWLLHEVDHTLPRLGIGGAVYLLPHMPSWRGQEKYYPFTFYDLVFTL